MKVAITKALVAAVTAVALFGCAQSGNITRDFQIPGYDPQLVQYMSATGEVPVVLVNNPFADDAMAAQLSLPSFYPQAPFVPTAPAGRENGHIILLFDPHISIDGQKACRDPLTGPAPATAPNGSLSVQAAFCYGIDQISEAHMVVARPDSPGDPAFRTAMAQLMNRLVPTISPNSATCMDADC